MTEGSILFIMFSAILVENFIFSRFCVFIVRPIILRIYTLTHVR